jgi:hypothetical protein
MSQTTQKIKIDFAKGLTFQLQKEKVLIQKNNQPHSSLSYSQVKTKKSYKEILALIPKWNGAVLIYGQAGDSIKPIDFTSSEYNLQEKFASYTKKSASGQLVDRFSWMEELLLSNQYKQLRIFTTTGFSPI